VLRVAGYIVRIRSVLASSPHPTHSQVRVCRPPHKGEVMAVCNIAIFKDSIARNTRLIGLDLGEKTIGIALSDTLLTVATPMETLKRGKFTADADKLQVIIEKQNVGGIVVGLPLNMDGSDGPSAQSARAFARNFAARSLLPILLWDERLSTAAVTRTLIDADASRRRRAEVVDKMAAAYILQGALERLRVAP
jgi:putative pre-16S rRNA nuclease